MSNVTVTTFEGVVTSPADTVGTTVTVFDGVLPGARFVLLEHGVTTPPDGTPTGSLVFEKGA